MVRLHTLRMRRRMAELLGLPARHLSLMKGIRSLDSQLPESAVVDYDALYACETYVEEVIEVAGA